MLREILRIRWLSIGLYMTTGYSCRSRSYSAGTSHGPCTVMSACTDAPCHVNARPRARARAYRPHGPFSEWFVLKARFCLRIVMCTGSPPSHAASTVSSSFCTPRGAQPETQNALHNYLIPHKARPIGPPTRPQGRIYI